MSNKTRESVSARRLLAGGRREAKMREASLFLAFSTLGNNLDNSRRISMSKGDPKHSTSLEN
jgi:hypothetical protein